ncbi:MAG: hypothetical protein HYU39_08550 [Thaumarchaeota archaeon]|nr:hypothetical protein [Nitrososphaerota archaeon]
MSNIDDKGLREALKTLGYSTLKRAGQMIRRGDTSLGVLLKQTEFARVVKKLKERFGNQSEQERYARMFVARIFNELLFDDANVQTVDGLVERMIGHLKGEPCEYTPRALIQGVIVKSGLVKIAANIDLRKVAKGDLDDMKNAFSPNSGESMSTDSILEAVVKTKNPREVQKIIKQTTAILRLYREGAVDTISYRLNCQCIEGMGDQIDSLDLRQSKPKYVIGMDESSDLNRFYDALSKRWTIAESWGEASDPVSIAFYYYSDSLLRLVPDEWRLATAIMGLEALYLTDKAEVGYKLATRIARLMNVTGLDGEIVQRTIRDAYRYRSMLVHGSSFTQKEREKVMTLLSTVWDCLRTSIIIFLLAGDSKPAFKESIIRTIDSSLVNPIWAEALKELVPDVPLHKASLEGSS